MSSSPDILIRGSSSLSAFARMRMTRNGMEWPCVEPATGPARGCQKALAGLTEGSRKVPGNT